MDNSMTTTKLLVLVTTMLVVAGLGGCGLSVREDRRAPNMPQKRSPAAREMTLEELTDIRPENIPPGVPCTFVNGKLRCTWCDVVINRPPSYQPSCPPR